MRPSSFRMGRYAVCRRRSGKEGEPPHVRGRSRQGGRLGAEKQNLRAALALAPSEAFPCQESGVEIRDARADVGYEPRLTRTVHGPRSKLFRGRREEERHTLAHARWQTNSTLSCAAELSHSNPSRACDGNGQLILAIRSSCRRWALGVRVTRRCRGSMLRHPRTAKREAGRLAGRLTLTGTEASHRQLANRGRHVIACDDDMACAGVPHSMTLSTYRRVMNYRAQRTYLKASPVAVPHATRSTRTPIRGPPSISRLNQRPASREDRDGMPGGPRSRGSSVCASAASCQ